MDEKKQEVKMLDLDALVPGDKEVKLGGKVWKISGSASTRIMLNLLRLGQEIEDAQENAGLLSKKLDEIYDVYYELFKGKNDGLTVDRFREIFDPIRHGPALSTYIAQQVKGAEKKTES